MSESSSFAELVNEWIAKAETDFASKSLEELEKLEDKCAMNGVMLRKQSNDKSRDPGERFELYRDSLRCEVRTRVAVYLQQVGSETPLDAEWKARLYEDVIERLDS